MIGNWNYGTGRRKSAVARVFIKAGTGDIVVNGKPIADYFSRETSLMIVRQPLELTSHATTFDIKVNVNGRRRNGSGRRGSPRHHPRADGLRRNAEADAVEAQASLPVMLVKWNVRRLVSTRHVAGSNSRSVKLYRRFRRVFVDLGELSARKPPACMRRRLFSLWLADRCRWQPLHGSSCYSLLISWAFQHDIEIGPTIDG